MDVGSHSGRRVLVVDDDAALRDMLVCDLGAAGMQVHAAGDVQAAIDHILSTPCDAVVTDLHLQGASGSTLCERIAGIRPMLPVIVMTGFGSIDTAVEVMRAGAADFLSKPFDSEELIVRLERAFAQTALAQEVARLRREVRASCGELQGTSEVMRRLFERIDLVGSSGAPVLIRGETGTGKELVAREIHRRSTRASGPLVAINCAALPEQLLESELFGHVRGAFTGALSARQGLFVRARGGTLFLDEIGELLPPLQAKLLRALQEGTVRPVGGDREVPFEAGLICATHRDLESMVVAGQFRQDFYYRICVLELEVPPLRERGNDVLLISESLIAAAASRTGKQVALSPAAARLLLRYPFPGNVRELANAIEHAVALCDGPYIEPAHFPQRVAEHSIAVRAGSEPSAELETLAEVERRHVLHVLSTLNGNVTHAARALGIDRKTLGLKLRSWGARPDR